MNQTPVDPPRPRLTRRAVTLLVRSFVVATVLTLGTAGAALLSLRSGADDVPGRVVGLFGSLYLTTSGPAGGPLDVDMGVANPTALLVIFVFCLTALVLTQAAHAVLSQYRDELIAARASL